MGLNLSSNVTTTMKAYQDSQSLTITLHQSGGTGSPIPTDQQGLIDAIQKLPATAAAGGKPFAVTVQRYDTLPSWPTGPISGVYSDLALLALHFGRLETVYATFEDVKQHPLRFVLGHGVTVPDVQMHQDEVRSALLRIKDAAQKCIDSQQANCQLETRDNVSDYTYRVFLPVEAGSFPEDISLTQLTQSEAQAEADLAALNAKVDAVNARGGFPRFHIDKNTWPPLVAARNKVASLKAQLAQANADYAGALKTAIVRQWIDRPSSIRCKSDVADPGCLSNAQITEWTKKVQTH